MTSELREQEHRARFERFIRPEVFANARPSEQPLAVFVGGQPGAGAGAALDTALQELRERGSVVQVIGEDFRPFHPRYPELLRTNGKTAATATLTDKDVTRWVEHAVSHAAENKYSLVTEATMQDERRLVATLQMLRAAGFTTEVRALAVHERWSWLSVMERYERQRLDLGHGRPVAASAHAASYAAAPPLLERLEREKLVDRVTVLSRHGEGLYANQLADRTTWQRAPGARPALEAERERPMSIQERAEYVRGVDRVVAMVKAPERKATPADLVAATKLERSAGQHRTGPSPYMAGKQVVAAPPSPPSLAARAAFRHR